ncbi:MAG: tyrosine recombinase XerC [Ketobacter sp.]|nr:tyrosine recombinase XerC [Ketobacter sp.]RLU00734.1 MAG: tyrosine recombinase XerC [Ketobacter sp.]
MDALDDSIARYLEHLTRRRMLSVNTVEGYRRDLAQLQQFCSRQQLARCRDIHPQHIRLLVAERHRRGSKHKTLQRLLASIRGLYNFLIQQGQAEANPAQGIRPPKGEKKLPHTLDVDQMNQLLNIDDSDPLSIRDLAVLELFYSSGLRLSELLNLHLADYDQQEHTVRVLGKGNKERVVPVGSKARDAIQRWLDLRDQFKPADDSLFVSQQGRPLHPSTLQKRFKQWGIKQGIDRHVHPHLLRHSFASHILESSGDLRSVQELLGHADISTTQIYTHLDFQHLAKVYDQAHPRAKKKDES